MYFWKYGLRTTWLDNRLKSAVSEYPSTSYVVNTPKHLVNLYDSTFIIVNIYCTGN